MSLRGRKGGDIELEAVKRERWLPGSATVASVRGIAPTIHPALNVESIRVATKRPGGGQGELRRGEAAASRDGDFPGSAGWEPGLRRATGLRPDVRRWDVHAGRPG